MFFEKAEVKSTIMFLRVKGKEGTYDALFSEGSNIDRGDTVDVHLIVDKWVLYPICTNVGVTEVNPVESELDSWWKVSESARAFHSQGDIYDSN